MREVLATMVVCHETAGVARAGEAGPLQNEPRNCSCLQVEREGQKRMRVRMSLDDRGAKNER